ncbi:P-loop containing nucleoside triphosphate hydrolase protein [Schizopora paradoxa]|uniref:p-loop containing nucleoside triphosphate hydrolase protein n=1 Tax=Schizopora paradoxa TaxID=27342 RepID=A0A0H2S4L6_9AGAM|nr:P-loop containing nucleoside triphosphate hydrolase protein [Schizopora paradoxa]
MGITETTEKPAGLEDKPTKPTLHSVQLGVWEIVFSLKSKSKSTFFKFVPSAATTVLETLSLRWLVVRMLKDMYSLAPLQLIMYVLFELCQSLQGGAVMYLNSQILNEITNKMSGRTTDTSRIAWSCLMRISLPFVSSWFRKHSLHDAALIKNRVSLHFMEKSIHTVLRLDLTTAEDSEVKTKMADSYFDDSDEIWTAFEGIFRVLFGVLRSFSQITLAFALIRQHASAPTFFALSLIQPLATLAGQDDLWGKTYAVFCINKAYERLAALHRFAFADNYRMDRLSDGVAEFIEKEFKKSRAELGDTPIDLIHYQWMRRRTLVVEALRSLTSDFTMLYFAFRVIFSSEEITFGSLVILQEAAVNMQRTIFMLSFESKNLASRIEDAKNVYARFDIKNLMKDGDVSYPINDASEKTGMKLEFRNVYFKYPGTTKTVLEDISFKIEPGQMVVIVGVNGSGKSSTIKLFNRLYDPTDGEILVDGLPLTSYKLKDIRRAMAILRQDHTSYPLSLRLNVALGSPDNEYPSDEELSNALRAGGADAFVEKLPKKLDTVLNPVKLCSLRFRGETEEELKKMVDEKEKTTDVSGGETQRLAAARTFMRLGGGGIRFLAADEPTSALDPEGEYELFSRLKEQRGGKTVVFITHRFGHLTKYADTILVLKDGRLVESGNHSKSICL